MSDPKPQPATPDEAPEARFEWTQSPFESFLEQHFKKVLILLLAIAVGVGGWLVYRQQVERTAIKQGEAFAAAQSLDDYKKIITDFPGTASAGSAQLMIANLLAENKDTAGAIEELNKFITTYPSHPMLDQAAFRAAVLTETKDGPDAGMAQYDAFVEKFPDSPLRPVAQMRKGDALVSLGKREEAISVYTSIQQDKSLYADPVVQAKARIEAVKLKPPTEVEFVPEPTPPPAPGLPTTPDGAAPAGLQFEAPSPAITIDPAAPPTTPSVDPAAVDPAPTATDPTPAESPAPAAPDTAAPSSETEAPKAVDPSTPNQ